MNELWPSTGLTRNWTALSDISSARTCLLGTNLPRPSSHSAVSGPNPVIHSPMRRPRATIAAAIRCPTYVHWSLSILGPVPGPGPRFSLMVRTMSMSFSHGGTVPSLTPMSIDPKIGSTRWSRGSSRSTSSSACSILNSVSVLRLACRLLKHVLEVFHSCQAVISHGTCRAPWYVWSQAMACGVNPNAPGPMNGDCAAARNAAASSDAMWPRPRSSARASAAR
mmetsp:Transcript_62973/g.104795  ORF Transcript_62973/g.104795 Transcript_62973/m.104795 type:complete len:223 (+) Transcript_62973:633-1301(+)